MAGKPKLEFKSNIPITVKINKMFKKKEAPEDHPDWGDTFCYDVTHGGVDKVYFAKERWHELVSEYPAGSTLVITFAEKKNTENNRTYHEWEVKQAFLDNDGRPMRQPEKPQDITKGDGYEQYRADRVKKLSEAIDDVMLAVARTVAAKEIFTPEDIRSMAISLLISFDKKTQ